MDTQTPARPPQEIPEAPRTVASTGPDARDSAAWAAPVQRLALGEDAQHQEHRVARQRRQHMLRGARSHLVLSSGSRS